MGKKVEVSYNPQLGYLQTIFHHNFDFLTGIKSYTERTDGVEFVVDTYKENTVKVFIQCVGEAAFRFRMYTPGNEHPFDNSIYQLEGQNGVNITENEEFISISKGKIEARVRKYPWEVSYYLDGKLKTKEQIKDSNVDNMCKNLPVGFTYDENKEIIGVNETMYLYADEEFYGFGEKFTDFGKRGQTINCWQTDALSTNTEKSYKNHPFFMSSRGYAILLNTYTRSKFEMGSFSNVAYNMSVEDKVLDYVIWIFENFGYDKYPGTCHIIPNAAVMILSMLYDHEDFSDTINICNMCGWDTDCNVGNVGTIMGVFAGIDGIDYDKWVKPINDFLACSNVLPSLNAVDIPFGASYFAKMAYVLAGEEIPENWNTILNERMDSCHFEYPTSTHAIRSYSPGDCYIRNTDEQAYTGKRSLKLTAVTSSGEESFFYKQTYYSSEDFDDSRYDPFFAPLVYPGQTVHLSVMPLPGEEMATTAQIYAKNGVTGEVIRGEKVKGDGEWHALSLEIPGGQTGHLSEVGVILCGVAKGFAMGDVAAYIDDLYFDGKPDYRLDFGRMKLDSWHVTHQEVPQFAKLKGHSYLDGQYLSLSCADFAEMYTGHHLWNNYRVTAVLKPVTSTEHFVNIRVQGAMRSYAAGFSKNNKLVLRKNYYGYITLCETDFEWKVDEEYKISLTADGSTISVSVNDKEYLKFTDSDLPLLTGCAGISVEKGSHCLYRDIAITGRE